MAQATRKVLRSTTSIPASDRKVEQSDNLPENTFSADIIELGRKLRENEIGVETGKAAGMERFARGAANGEFDMDTQFNRLFLDWRYGENVAQTVDRKHAAEMSRFRSVCAASIVAKRAGGDFLKTIEKVRATVEAMKGVTGKDAVKPKQLDQAIYSVANAQKAVPTLVSDTVIAKEVATPIKAAPTDPLGDMLKALTKEVSTLLDTEAMRKRDIEIPRDMRPMLRDIEGTLKRLQDTHDADVSDASEPATA